LIAVNSPGRKIVVLFTTKYALPHQIKPRILELSIRRRQSNSSIVLTFVGCEEIGCYCGDVVSAGQLSVTTVLQQGLFVMQGTHDLLPESERWYCEVHELKQELC